MTPSLVIDGNVLEGGGQILRNAVAYSALLKRPIQITNVRFNRKPPGLKNQHVSGLKLVSDLCSATVTGVEKGSTKVDFVPGALKSGHFKASPQTAAATTLLLQAVLPCLLLGGATSTITLEGGTNATSAPQIDYTSAVFLPFIRQRFGWIPALKVLRRGYFPKGGGKVFMSVDPLETPLPALNLLERGNVTIIRGRAIATNSLPRHLVQMMIEGATKSLVAAGFQESSIHIEPCFDDTAIGSGSAIVLWAETDKECILGGSAVGSKGTGSRQTGKDAAEELLRNLEHGGCVDEYLQDQIIIFMVLAQGLSTIATGPLTLHTRTAIWIAEQITEAKFFIEDDTDSKRTIIKCEGIGLQPANVPDEGYDK